MAVSILVCKDPSQSLPENLNLIVGERTRASRELLFRAASWPFQVMKPRLRYNCYKRTESKRAFSFSTAEGGMNQKISRYSDTYSSHVFLCFIINFVLHIFGKHFQTRLCGMPTQRFFTEKTRAGMIRHTKTEVRSDTYCSRTFSGWEEPSNLNSVETCTSFSTLFQVGI